MKLSKAEIKERTRLHEAKIKEIKPDYDDACIYCRLGYQHTKRIHDETVEMDKSIKAMPTQARFTA